MIKYFADQVLEYHGNDWLEAGNLQKAREDHAVLSIGPQELPCLTGGCFNRVERKDADYKGSVKKNGKVQ